MPELPEVEHAKRELGRWLKTRIERAEADPTRIFRGADRRAFEAALAGRRLARIDRRGKYLALAFDGDVGVISHLGMTGKWVRRRAGEVPPSHSRVRLHLEGGAVIHYDDPRLFGRIALTRARGILAHPTLAALGPDPLHDGIDPERLGAVLGRSARAVKVALMDQAVLAGVGNILAIEALFRARIHPARPSRSLSAKEIAALARAQEQVIERSLSDLRSEEEIVYLSSGSGASNPFVVYDRAGEPCPRCRAALVNLVIGGRSSVHCPRCQPAARRRGA